MNKPLFENQCMSGATFRDVHLSEAVFEDVNLSSARFEDVRLHGATLKNVDLSGVKIEDAVTAGLSIDGMLLSDLLTQTGEAGKGGRLSAEIAREFVGVSHGNLERVKELLEQEPKLVNASWDWGGGDWETGLGAAAHTGQRGIAELLLSRGARMDIFAAAMLGKLEVVMAILTAHPESLHAPGPHGIPLMVHAQVGGEAASEVVEYLNSLV